MSFGKMWPKSAHNNTEFKNQPINDIFLAKQVSALLPLVKNPRINDISLAKQVSK